MRESFFESLDYRVLLKLELEIRRERNPRYSLRAFARQLGIGHARMSEIIRGKQGLSQERAKKLAQRLWGQDEMRINYFIALVAHQHSRRAEDRDDALKLISAMKATLCNKKGEAPWELFQRWFNRAAVLLSKEQQNHSIARLLEQLGTEKDSLFKELVERGLVKIIGDEIILSLK